MSEEALVVNHRDVSTWDETVDVLVAVGAREVGDDRGCGVQRRQPKRRLRESPDPSKNAVIASSSESSATLTASSRS